MKEINGLYNKTKISSGLNIISLEMPYRNGVAVGLVTKIGSRNDPLNMKGMAHLVEHMLFKGTEKRNAYTLTYEIEKLGGNLDAYTTREETAIWTYILSEHTEIAFDIISDMFYSSTFKLVELEKEKKVVIEEMNDIEDNPSQKIGEIYPHLLWGKHPLAYPILGNKTGIYNITDNNITDFYFSNYTLENSFLIAVGKINHTQLIELCEKWFNRKRERILFDTGLNPVENQNNNRFYLLDKKTIQDNVIVGVPIFPYSDNKRYPFYILDTILGRGASSRLFQRLREEFGYVYSVYPFAEYFTDSGFYGIYIASEKKNVKNAMDLLYTELEKFPETVTQKEIDDAKVLLKGRILLDSEGILAQFNRITELEILIGDYLHPLDEIKMLESVTIDDVKSIAREYLNPDKMTGLILGKKPSKWTNSKWGDLNKISENLFTD